MNKKQAKYIVDELNWKYEIDIKLNDFIGILDQHGYLDED